MKIIKYETNWKHGLFFKSSNVKSKNFKNEENKILNVYPEIEYQEIIGFGGAFTESAGYAYSKLTDTNKEKVLLDLFSKEGLNYCLGRLPIGSSDFSLKSYSYSNEKDLSDFSIEKDKEYLIPFIKDAQNIKNFVFFSSPWSPPKFMKNNKMLILGGKLKKEYYELYAKYLKKYIESYKNEGIVISYMNMQNEPEATQVWESCIYSLEEEIEFANYMKDSGVKLLLWDHNKDNILTRSAREFKGIAYHYYTGDHFENIQILRDNYPEYLLIHSEGCTGYTNFNKNEEVKNAEIYAHDIIGDLTHGSNGYIDWNLLLDEKGGPNHKHNYCNSPIMLNPGDTTSYYKNLSYYYIKHFSNLIEPGAKRIGFSRYTDGIEIATFKNPDGTIIVVLLNKNETNYEYNLHIGDQLIHDNLDTHAIVSYSIALQR